MAKGNKTPQPKAKKRSASRAVQSERKPPRSRGMYGATKSSGFGDKKQNKRATEQEEDLLADEFAVQKDTLRLDRRAHPTGGDMSEEESEDDSMQDEEQNVLDLDLDEDSDDDDDDEEGDDDDGAEEEEEDVEYTDDAARRLIAEAEEEQMAEMKQRAEADESRITGQWGRTKKSYYNADTTHFDLGLEEDQRAAEDEEVEALRMQREQAEDRDEEDYGLDELRAAMEESKDTTKDSKKKKKKKEKSFKTSRNVREVTDADEDESAVEKVQKDLSGLSKEEKMEILVNDTPELIGLLDELKTHVHTVNTQLKPLLEKARATGDEALQTSKGVSFLEMRYQLLMNYCTNISFYLLLKAEGKSVKDHPVIKHLVELRAVVEKTKAIDKKLQYQVKKLIRQASTADAGGVAHKDEAASSNALRFKPNPSALAGLDGDDDEGSGSGEEKKESGVFKPSRLMATPFGDEDEADEDSKRSRRRQKQLRTLASSSLMADLTGELMDRPEEIRDETLYGMPSKRKQRSEDDDQEAYEEDNFVRLVESKKDRKKRERAQAGVMDSQNDLFKDLAAVGNLTDVIGADDELTPLERYRMSKLNKGVKKKRKVDPQEEAEARALAAESAELYEQAAKASRKKKAEKAETYAAPTNLLDQVDPDVAQTRPDGKRAVTQEILTNKVKGLQRYRRKDQKNPRVKKREQYRKALIKRKSQVSEYKEQTGVAYGGQATGIKAHLVRSRKMEG